MLVSHLLRVKGRDVVHVTTDTIISDVVRLLSERRIGAVLVLDSGGGLAGILSERDIVHALAVDGAAALGKRAEVYMTADVTTCEERDAIDEIMEIMTHGRFRHLPVVEGDGGVVGVISIGDVVKSRIAETVGEAETLRDYIAAR